MSVVAKKFAEACRDVYAEIARLRKASRSARIYEGTEAADALWQKSDLIFEEHTNTVRDLVARLPFEWITAHAYTPRETANYGGDDHIMLLEDFSLGRFKRKAKQTIGEPPSHRFWGLEPTLKSENRLPTCCACLGQAMALIIK